MSTSEATAEAVITTVPAKNPIEAAREVESVIEEGARAARRVTVLETIKKVLEAPIAADRKKTLIAMRLRRSRIVRSDYKTAAAYNKALKEASVFETPLGGLSYKSPGTSKPSISDAEKHLAWAMENAPDTIEDYQEIDSERIHEAIAYLAEHKPELILARKRVAEEAESALLKTAVRGDDDEVKVPVGAEPVLVNVDFIKFSTPTAENTTWSASKSKSAGEDAVEAWLEGNREGIITAIAGALTSGSSAGSGA